MIRGAEKGDIPDILAIWNVVIRETLITFNAEEKTAADLAVMLDHKAQDGHAFLVALHEGRVAGFATYGQFRAGVGYAHTMEHTIVLGPGARGQGLGRALMDRIEDHARRGGAHSIYAGVSGGNPRAEGFHAALGYVTVARLAEAGFKFGKWWDLILMQKFLT